MLVSPCAQSQLISLISSSSNVVVQDNIWQISFDQTTDSSPTVSAVRVNTEGQLITGTISLTLTDVSQTQFGPYEARMENSDRFTFENLPWTALSMIQLQFPDGSQPRNYMIDIVTCSQTNDASSTSKLLFIELL